MNIMVIGGGMLGRKTAELLDSAGHDVAITDENPENIHLLSPNFGGITFVGFPMDLNHLREAGIDNCDAVAVTTADDNLNITVGQIAKDVFGVPKVVVRISDPAREDIFESFGLSTVCPTNMAGEKIVSSLIAPLQSHQVTFGTATVALEARAVDKRQAGGTTQSYPLDPGEGILGVVKSDGRFFLQGPDTQIPLEQGDQVICSRKID